MSYLADYCFYNSGNECPESYHIWAGLAAFSSVLSRRVWLNYDYYQIFPNIYVVLIGDAGSGKNTAKDSAILELLSPLFPDIPISASVTSREDVAKFMGSEEGLRSFRMPDDSLMEYRPFVFAVNEFANLLSVDMRKMTDFLVDLYDSRFFSMSFKRDSVKDKIPNPCATMLACCVPDWFMRTLKYDIFTGGLGRRLNMVYENRTILKAHPTIPEGGHAAWARVKEHLMCARELVGEIKKSKEGEKWWDRWYMNYERLKTEDPILKQLYATKHVTLQKIAILMALDTRPFKLVIEPEHFISALALMESLEPAVKTLSAGVGRNELAAVSVQVLDTMKNRLGACPEKVLRRMYFRDCKLQGREFDGMLEHLIATGQLYSVNLAVEGKLERTMLLPEQYEKYMKGQL